MTMGGKKYNWRDYLAWGLLLLSVFTLVWATAIDHSPGNTDQAARRVEKVLARRMARATAQTASSCRICRKNW